MNLDVQYIWASRSGLQESGHRKDKVNKRCCYYDEVNQQVMDLRGLKITAGP